MSGIKFLLDTNILIGLLNGHPESFELLEKHQAEPGDCAYSNISRMELLSWPSMTSEQELQINNLLQLMRRIPLGMTEEDATITLRRSRAIKLPDAIIAATAKVNELQLLTLDQKLAALMKNH